MKRAEIKSIGLNCKLAKFLICEMILLEFSKLTWISPFITDFPVSPPKNCYSKSKNFVDFLFDNVNSKQIKLEVYTTSKGAKSLIERNTSIRADLVKIYKNDKIHEKTLLTSHFFYKGSANFTYMGMNSNLESCEIGLVRENPDFSPFDFW